MNPLQDGKIQLRSDDPFESIESAHSFLTLLRESVAEARGELQMDVQRASKQDSSRRLEATRIAAYKAEKLEFHLTRRSRLLNDLRSLRRLLFEERIRGRGSHSDEEEVVASSERTHRNAVPD